MNPVEIEEAISDLAEQKFNQAEFPYEFLKSFGVKETTISRLKSGSTNSSDIPGAILQRNSIHISACSEGQVELTFKKLRASPRNAAVKAKFILVTDGLDFEAEDLNSGEVCACAYKEFPEHFGFFLPLAGISAVKEIINNPIDIKATGRLNKLYLELLRTNPDWALSDRRTDLNHFLARLIFCFFAEDTGIFSSNLFTSTVEQMTDAQSTNTHEVICELFKAMDTNHEERKNKNIRSWAEKFPYVNGGLFTDTADCPRFSRVARSYLLRTGELDWKTINPDIFGSMIQSVAEDDERGSFGMHYTSVPNILKVLNPLFLDDLRQRLEAAGNNTRMLLNLQKRMTKIRVFDPACGSGNFLVIAYKEMRAIEAEINYRRKDGDFRSKIPLTNFRGIELRSFPAEIARLALIIAEYQCDVTYRSQREALEEFLPLDTMNWITCGNALKLDWLSLCPPTGKSIKLQSDDLFDEGIDQPLIDFENEGGETYICGNPPYKGSKLQSTEQKHDLINAWAKYPKLGKTTDYVTGWFARFFDYLDKEPSAVGAFVTTNSVCQGQQAAEIWPTAYQRGIEIQFAHTSFKWENLANNNAGVTVVIIGLGKKSNVQKKLYDGATIKYCSSIGPYLIADNVGVIEKASYPNGPQSIMLFGNMPRDGGHLIIDVSLAKQLMVEDKNIHPFMKKYVGSEELINGKFRYCLWIKDENVSEALKIKFIAERLELVSQSRSNSDALSTRQYAKLPHRFVQIAGAASHNQILIPAVSSENREYLPCGLMLADTIVSNRCFVIYDAPIWNIAIIASKLHWIWIDTVCGKLETRFNYSNTLGWNTFPLPILTEKNKTDLSSCAENILLARERHFPATIADLYDPKNMPEDLRLAHETNDEILERIYIGRKFKNDSERLEKLFEIYAKKNKQ